MRTWTVLLIPSALFFFSINVAFAKFYADVNLGPYFAKTSKDLTYPLTKVPPTQNSFTSSNNDFHGQFALGYNFFKQNKWQFAIEGNVDFYTGKSTATINNWFFTTSANATEKFN